MTTFEVDASAMPSDYFPFDATIVPRSCEGFGPARLTRSFRVSERLRRCDTPLTRDYDVGEPSQDAYHLMFETLARDFGTRRPPDRRLVLASDFTAPFRPLLTEALSPDILYGYGDPCVLRVTESMSPGNGGYYLVATSNDAGESLPILRSTDLREWHLAGFVFPREVKPPWAASVENGGEYWAPELHYVNGKFVVCFTAREADGSLAIGLAWSGAPAGPFVSAAEPLLRGGVIDPHIFVDDDGSATMYWKEDNNDVWPTLLSQFLHDHPECIVPLFPAEEDGRTAHFNALLWPWVLTLPAMERCFVQQVLIEAVVADFNGFRNKLKAMLRSSNSSSLRGELADLIALMRTAIYGQRLDTERWSLDGERTIVLENDLDWEGHIVEGVWVTKQDGRYFVFYSGNDFSTARYGIGVGVSNAPLGPFVKAELPFLRSTSDWYGPGHASVAQDPAGSRRLQTVSRAACVAADVLERSGHRGVTP